MRRRPGILAGCGGSAALAITAMALSGCSGSGSQPAVQGSLPHAGSAQQMPASAAQAANPVTIVTRAGAVTADIYGQLDVEGDRYAQGSFPHAGSESVLVYTFASIAAQQQDEARNIQYSAQQDSKVCVTGKLFILTVYGAVSADLTSYTYPVSPAAIAARVGGVVVTGGC